MERAEMERLVRTPLVTGRDLRIMTKPLGISSYRSHLIFEAMMKTYEQYARRNNYVVFPHSVPNAIAFDYLTQFGITKEKILDDDYWK